LIIEVPMSVAKDLIGHKKPEEEEAQSGREG
jgi:hypothetical protein